MLRLLSVFVFLICTHISYTSHAEKVKVKFLAKVGDKAKATIHIKKSDPNLERRGGKITSITKYDIEVMGKSSSGLVIKWTPTSFDIKGLPEDVKKLLMPSLRTMILPVVYSTNSYAAPQRLHNKKETLELIKSFLIKSGRNDHAILNKVMSLFEAMDEKSIALLLGREPGLLARWQTGEFDTGKTVSYEDLRPSPMGGRPINMITTVSSKKVKGNRLKISYRTKVDPQKIKTFITNFFRKMSPEGIKSVPNFKKFNIVFNESGSAVVDLKDGWTRSTTHFSETIVTINSRQRKNTKWTKIELTKGAERTK